MPTISPILKAQLDACTDKMQYSNTIKTALGTSRRVRCYRDANAAATDPSSTGTEFLNMALTGDISIVSGNIVGWGNTGTTTVRTAADLSTGASVMVIEGGGHTISYTLGLTGSGAEYTLPASPDGSANTGYAFVAGAGMKAPHLLPSGTGPAAPAIASTTPTILELVDWSDPANPLVVGTISTSSATRQDDWVFQHPELAAEIGDIGVYQFNGTITWTSPVATRRFEMGGLLLMSAANNSIDGTTQVEQILISFKPYGRWSSYPAMDTFVRATYPVVDASTWPYTFGPCSNPDTADRTILPPFKVNLYTVAGYNGGAVDRTPVYTHEWKAFNDKPAYPINSPSLSEVQTADEPSIPRFNCAMMLPWQNVQTRLSSKAGKYFNGVDSFAYDGDYAAKAGPSSNAYAPLSVYEASAGTAGTQQDSMAHWYALPPYPLKADFALDDTYLTAYESRPKDAGLFTNRDHYPAYRYMGYKWQAGSISGHDWITGKGGVRFDRSVMNAPIAIYTSNQNWIRPEGNVPIRDLVDNWGLAYFNHSNRWMTNVQTFVSVPKADILAGTWALVGTYYGNDGAVQNAFGTSKCIDICGIPNGKSRWTTNNDPEGFMYYSAHQRDSLHSYSNAGVWAILLNSAMHAIAQTHDFNEQWMCSLGDSKPTADPTGYYGIRVHAWRMLSYTIQWMCSTEHYLGYSRNEIESRLQIELDSIYDNIYKPAFIDNAQTLYSTSIRNLGVGCSASGNNLQSIGGGLGLYMVHVLVLMRQFGLWSVMRARSDKGQKVLDMMIRNLDLMVIDYVLDTSGRDNYYPTVASGKTAGNYTVTDIPASWAAQKVMLDTYLPTIPETSTASDANNVGTAQQWKDWFIRYDNTAAEHPGCTHLYMQYLKARRDYFPDYPAPRLADAITKMQGYYDAYATARANGLAYKMAYLYPAHGALNPPTELGPK
jgi:hypothetical protein